MGPRLLPSRRYLGGRVYGGGGRPASRSTPWGFSRAERVCGYRASTIPASLTCILLMSAMAALYPWCLISIFMSCFAVRFVSQACILQTMTAIHKTTHTMTRKMISHLSMAGLVVLWCYWVVESSIWIRSNGIAPSQGKTGAEVMISTTSKLCWLSVEIYKLWLSSQIRRNTNSIRGDPKHQTLRMTVLQFLHANIPQLALCISKNYFAAQFWTRAEQSLTVIQASDGVGVSIHKRHQPTTYPAPCLFIGFRQFMRQSMHIKCRGLVSVAFWEY